MSFLTREEGPDGMKQAVSELKKHHIEDHLKKGLEQRHSKEELVQKHILHGNARVLADLISAEGPDTEQKWQKVEENLTKGLDHRPSKEELVQKHILPGFPYCVFS